MIVSTRFGISGNAFTRVRIRELKSINTTLSMMSNKTVAIVMMDGTIRSPRRDIMGRVVLVVVI